MAGDGRGGSVNPDGAGGRRHRVAVDVRGVIHRGRVVRRRALADHRHRHVIRDARARRERDRAGEVRPDQTARAGTVVGNGRGNKLVIRRAERVFERQIIHGDVAGVLHDNAENHVAADGHRRVGRT